MDLIFFYMNRICGGPGSVLSLYWEQTSRRRSDQHDRTGGMIEHKAGHMPDRVCLSGTAA